MKNFTYKTPVGNIYIQEKNSKISAVSFFEIADGEYIETPLIKETHRQLCEYFDGNRKAFDIPLLMEGSEFQLKVWKALLNIEYGHTLTYGELAVSIGNSKASRAVGNANNKNKIAIIIPCHRVIGANGSLTGYAGGLETKRYLLNLENISYNK
ncbi:methylated-DNA--[protein]-cysteine S-methyltransferase [bacterium]|nr:methylated-DNA--[protein]-cysteine S-methyltransferase [bacterium]